jgi:lipoate-protein ligase A
MVLEIHQDGADDGDRLMAYDVDLLQRAARHEIGPTLRFYTWSEPTISLGFHQSSEVLNLPKLARDHMPWTRRPTGGAAVLHSEELTYAIVALLPDAGGGKRLQQYVSVAIAEGLRSLGVSAEVDERGEPLSALSNRASCFVRTSRWEVTVRGRKLVGSAQRKLGDAYLQHGSILIGEDHLRIVDYLSMSSEPARELLRHKLQTCATTISAELKFDVNGLDLRRCLARSFKEKFSLLLQDHLEVAV